MTFGDKGSYAILNPYDALYLLLHFVPLITNHPVYVYIERVLQYRPLHIPLNAMKLAYAIHMYKFIFHTKNSLIMITFHYHYFTHIALFLPV